MKTNHIVSRISTLLSHVNATLTFYLSCVSNIFGLHSTCIASPNSILSMMLRLWGRWSMV